MDNVRRMEKATERRREKEKDIAQRTEAQSSMTRMSSDLAGLLISIGKIVRRVGNPKTSRKESDVAVMLERPLHVSKVGQSKNGKTKQATLISD